MTKSTFARSNNNIYNRADHLSVQLDLSGRKGESLKVVVTEKEGYLIHLGQTVLV